MLYDYLAEFAMVAREKSFAKAARELSLSEATLSRHMRALEADLGVELLDRRTSGSELTQQGRHVYRYAADMVDLLDAMERELYDAKDDDSILVCGLLKSPLYMRALCTAYARCDSGLRSKQGCLRFIPHQNASGSQEVGRLLAGEVALFVTFSSSSALAHLDDTYEVVELFHPRLVACMQPSNSLAQKELLLSSDLVGQLLLHTDSNNLQARSLWKATCGALHDRGVSFRSKSTYWDCESDFFNSDADEGILLLPEKNQIVDLHVSYGRTVMPVEDLRVTLVGCFAKDDASMAWLADSAVDFDSLLEAL